jgi:hypothetical protein
MYNGSLGLIGPELCPLDTLYTADISTISKESN